MHMQGEPRSMQHNPQYVDVLAEVTAELLAQARLLEALGVARQRIAIDPGCGFGKSVAQNYALLGGVDYLAATGYPVLLGVSRKSMIGAVTGRPVSERLAGSIAAALAGVSKGAAIIRVHDVAPTLDAINVWFAAQQGAART